MKETPTFSHVIPWLLLFMAGCDRPPCTNTNPVFDRFSPGAKEYKDELVKQLAAVDKSKLTYWINAYEEDNGSEYLLANIQGDGLCAKILLSVKDSQKGIEGVLKRKGDSYIGAQLEDLKFSIAQDSVNTEFIFQEISGIAD